MLSFEEFSIIEWIFASRGEASGEAAILPNITRNGLVPGKKIGVYLSE